MKLKCLLLSVGTLMFGSLSSASAQFITFGPGVKVVFTQVVEDGHVVTKAEATVSETDPATGVITVKRQTEVIVPDPSGGYIKKETQETTVATPDAGGGTFTVETQSDVLTTPLDETETPTGGTTTVTENAPDQTVDAADIITTLPQSTQFVPVDDELDEVIVISPS